ncbi:hypothetical protein C7M84_018138 [Penaeus vannamei]|uniref:Uncharacterized protein n=1 Tax=Penaeus vannamei TaxID=6689 RepID=A0A3R7PYZ4_PENVA|nr:hypothetical protein C7M84_018138 [Penaeus vannamei]
MAGCWGSFLSRLRVRPHTGEGDDSVARPEQRPRRAPSRARALLSIAIVVVQRRGGQRGGGGGEGRGAGRPASQPGTGGAAKAVGHRLLFNLPHTWAPQEEGRGIAGGFFPFSRKGVHTRDLTPRYRETWPRGEEPQGAQPSRGEGRKRGAALGNHSERQERGGRLCEGQDHSRHWRGWHGDWLPRRPPVGIVARARDFCCARFGGEGNSGKGPTPELTKSTGRSPNPQKTPHTPGRPPPAPRPGRGRPPHAPPPRPGNASLSRGWRAGSNGPPAANPAAPPCPRPPRSPAGPEGGLRAGSGPEGDPRPPCRVPAQPSTLGRGWGEGRALAGQGSGDVAATACRAAARRHPNEGGPPCSCRRGPTQPTRPRGRGRSAPGAREGSPSDGPGSQASPKACPAFGDGSRRQGLPHGGGGTPAAASAPGPRGRRGQESPSRPPGGCRRGPSANTTANRAPSCATPREDALRTPHHPRPGKRLTFSRGGLLGPAPDPRGTRARLAAFQPSPARSAGGGPPCSCRRGPTQPTRPRGRGRSAPGAREGSPSDGPGSQASPKACPAFGDGSRRGRGFLTAAGGTPAAASAPGPRGRRGQESPSRPPGGEAQPAGGPRTAALGPRPAPTASSPPARSCRRWSPYSCRRGPSANTTANRAPSCATPRERTPSARPTTHAPGGLLGPAPDPRGTRARLAAFQPSPARSAGGGPPCSCRRGPTQPTRPRAGAVRPRGQGRQPLRRPRQPGLPQSLSRFRGREPERQGLPHGGGGTPAAASAPGPRGRRGQESPSRPPGGPPVVVGAGPQPHTTAPRARPRPSGRPGQRPVGGAAGPRPNPTPPPSAREGARGRWGEARANPCSKEDEAGRPGQGPPPSAREGAGGPKGQGKAQAVPWPAKEDVAERPRWAGRPPLARSGQAAARGKGPNDNS